MIMKKPFPHDMRAVLSCAGNGLSLKKITAAAFYLLIGQTTYLIFTYLALLYDGVSFDYIRQSYGLFPFRLFPFDSAIAYLVYFAGIGGALTCLSLAIMSVAVITFEEIRGDYFFSVFKAIRFSFSRLPSLLGVHFSLLAFIAFIYLLGVITGIIGRIPYLGETIIGVFYLFPIFISLIFTVFIIFVMIVGVILVPIVLASQKRKEIFDGILQLFSVLTQESWRFFWYLAISCGLAKTASFLMAYLFYRTLQFSQLVLIQGGGEKIERLFNSAYNLLPLNSPVLLFMTNIFPGIDFGFRLSRWGYGGDESVAAVILAVSFFILFVILCGYMMSVFSSGLARGYAVIRRMKDDYFIVDESPLEEYQDYVNPPLKENSSG